MSTYHNFIGIDIGKYSFVSALFGHSEVREYKYTPEGIGQFLSDYEDSLSDSLCILETTGGYELELLYTLCGRGYSVHRADTRKVKNFIRSYGNAAKTDKLDAIALARYGRERKEVLDLYEPQSKLSLELYELVGRRMDLKKALVAEKNRLKSPCTNLIRGGIEEMIQVITNQLDQITQQMEIIIQSDEPLQQKKEVLKTIPGIGNLTASDLLVLLPELGTIDRRKIAALAGLAPKANDSGIHRGYRRTTHGRTGIKPVLFMAAMTAARSKSSLGDYYGQMIARGKKKRVALTALMRKILVIANAKIRDLQIQ